MNSRNPLLPLLFAFVAVLCASCGGGSGGGHASSGVALSIKWPAKGRYLPAYADEVKIKLQSKANEGVAIETTAERPDNGASSQTVRLQGSLPGGAYTLKVSAAMQLEGKETVAEGQKDVEIVPGQTSQVEIDLDSTLVELEVDYQRIPVDGSEDLSATGFTDTEGIIPLAARYLQWVLTSELPAISPRGEPPVFFGEGSLTSDGTFTGSLSGPVGIYATEVGANVSGYGNVGIYNLLGSTAWPNRRGGLGSLGRSAFAGDDDPGRDFTRSFESSINSSPTITADGSVIVTVSDGSVYSYSPSGTLEWSTDTGAPIYGSAAIGKDGTLYVVNFNGVVNALKESDGDVRWTSSIGRASGGSPTIGANGYLYVGDDGGYLNAIDTADGVLQWSYQSGGGYVESCPAVGADGTVYATAEPGVGEEGGFVFPFGQQTPQGKVFAVNGWDGDQVWSVNASNPAGAALSADGDSVFVVIDNDLVQLDAIAGSVVGSTQVDTQNVNSTPAIGRNGLVYVCTRFNDRIVAVDPVDEEVEWTFEPPSSFGIKTREVALQAPEGSVTVNSLGHVLVGVDDGGVYLLNKDSGAEIWESFPDAGVAFQAPIIGPSGRIYYIDAEAFELVALSESTG